MTRDEIINSIWIGSSHGTEEKDIEDAFSAGILFCKKQAIPLVSELLEEALGLLDDANGCKPSDVIGYTGWADRARKFISDIDGDNLQ
jgi:hypothetical protein